MDKSEAKRILDKELLRLRTQSHEDLQELIISPLVVERKGASGVSYQIEIQALWDNPREAEGDLRVIGSIDDGGFLSAFMPLSSDFIINSEGKVGGE